MDHAHHGGDHSGHDMHAGHDMAGMVHDVVKAVVNGTVGSMMGHDHSQHMARDGSTTHNHGAMTSHDHGAMTTGHDHGSGGMTGHGMSMYFHFGYEDETVLFEGWTLNSVEALVGTCIGVFFLAIFYEGLKYFREYLYKRSATSVHYSSVSVPSPADGTSPVPKKGHSRSIRVQMLSSSHFIQTLLHLVQITLSYFLMLIVMTYNAWLMIAICAGAAVGYFLFGWSKAHVVDITEHCH